MKKFSQWLEEQNRLTSSRSGVWSGKLYRAVDSTQKTSALGDGTYYTGTREDAELYGSNIVEYEAHGLNVLGTNSQEHKMVKRTAGRRWSTDFRSMADAIAKTAEQEGWDAIYGGGVFGLVVFPSSTEKVKPL